MSDLVYDRQSDRWMVVCRDGSRVYFYRAVMEAHLGRPLRTDEHVHHRNGDPSDDRLENLELLDIGEHGRFHGTEAWVVRKGEWDHAWAEQHACCVECSTTERSHTGHGLCSRCYHRIYMAQRRKAMAA